MDRIGDSTTNAAIAKLEKELHDERAVHTRELRLYRLMIMTACLLGIFSLYYLTKLSAMSAWCNEVARIYNEQHDKKE
jgi:hypothetical protein